mmetsp:Transcript_125150/g.267138  ORF Transcript_125150/g.267138 Transcript_125150/m.267138 type:complete len:350 (-) Transcript_125150:99-1148(-)
MRGRNFCNAIDTNAGVLPEDGVQQQLDGCGPVAHVHREALLHEVARRAREALGEQGSDSSLVCIQNVNATTQHEVSAKPAGPNVDALVPGLPGAQLRGSVGATALVAENPSPVDMVLAAKVPGRAQVGYLQGAGAALEREPGGLEVTVCDPLLVQIADALDELEDEIASSSLLEVAMLAHVALDVSVDAELHAEPNIEAAFKHRLVLRDGVVAQARHELVLAAHRLASVLVAAAYATHRHVAAIRAPSRPPHHAHGAGAVEHLAKLVPQVVERLDAPSGGLLDGWLGLEVIQILIVRAIHGNAQEGGQGVQGRGLVLLNRLLCASFEVVVPLLAHGQTRGLTVGGHVTV